MTPSAGVVSDRALGSRHGPAHAPDDPAHLPRADDGSRRWRPRSSGASTRCSCSMPACRTRRRSLRTRSTRSARCSSKSRRGSWQTRAADASRTCSARRRSWRRPSSTWSCGRSTPRSSAGPWHPRCLDSGSRSSRAPPRHGWSTRSARRVTRASSTRSSGGRRPRPGRRCCSGRCSAVSSRRPTDLGVPYLLRAAFLGAHAGRGLPLHA